MRDEIADHLLNGRAVDLDALREIVGRLLHARILNDIGLEPVRRLPECGRCSERDERQIVLRAHKPNMAELHYAESALTKVCIRGHVPL